MCFHILITDCSVFAKYFLVKYADVCSKLYKLSSLMLKIFTKHIKNNIMCHVVVMPNNFSLECMYINKMAPFCISFSSKCYSNYLK